MFTSNTNLTSSTKRRNIEKIVILQALWRGAMVRKKLTGLRKTYKGLCNAIEAGDGEVIEWKSQKLCLPLLTKSYDKPSGRNKGELQEQANYFGISQTTGLSENKTSSVDTSYLRTESKPLLQDRITPKNSNRDKKEDIIQEDACVQTDSVAKQCDREIVDSESENNLENPQKHLMINNSVCPEKNKDSPCLLNLTTVQGKVHQECSKQDEDQAGNTPEALTTSKLIISEHSKSNDRNIRKSRAESALLKEESFEELQTKRSLIAMELLWVQQAIDSRKEYLKLRTKAMP